MDQNILGVKRLNAKGPTFEIQPTRTHVKGSKYEKWSHWSALSPLIETLVVPKLQTIINFSAQQ
jgi:hypothetical protein